MDRTLGLFLFGAVETHAWLLKLWGFLPSITIMEPLSIGAMLTGLGFAFQLQKRK